LYGIALSFYLPAVYINFARKGTFGSCFEIREIIKIVSENTSQYLTAWLISIVAAIGVGIVIAVAATLLGWIICLGWILAWLIGAIGSVYIYAIFSHLFGQVSAQNSLSTSVLEVEE
jgi:NhaP-type Na+/H+ and K+/H+ antiporter